MAETLEQKKQKLEQLKAIDPKPLNIIIAIFYLEADIEKQSKKLDNGS